MDAKVGEGRYLAEHIPRATFLELPGRDHLPWVHDANSVLDAIEQFLAGLNLTEAKPRTLVTILAVHESGGERERLHLKIHEAWNELLVRFRGEPTRGGIPSGGRWRP